MSRVAKVTWFLSSAASAAASHLVRTFWPASPKPSRLPIPASVIALLHASHW
ncbi:MAG: hypothetical protein IPH14_02490 [Thermomonas sp.]|uniref:hypothetical protein n=1 Tax=Thermomonas sp. TaxID=1971895 RepID=UPI0025E82106|nr:hypothetical protein [Thermomonas sp.]MBK6924150.1 hypothetical protein [Thermomonas sp.]